MSQWVSVCSWRAWQLCQAGSHHISCFKCQTQMLSVTLLPCYYFISCKIYATSETFLQTQPVGTLSSFKYPVICPVIECCGFSYIYFSSSWTFCSANRLVFWVFWLCLPGVSILGCATLAELVQDCVEVPGWSQGTRRTVMGALKS